METIESVAEKIEDIGNKVFDKHDVGSRPYGDKWMMIVVDIMREIILDGLVEKINDEVLDILEDDNYHTAGHAAGAVKDLCSYAFYNYARK